MLSLVALLALAPLALVPAGDASDAYPPTLLVQAFGTNFSLESREVDVTVDLTGETRAPGRIAILAPKHFPLEASRIPGSPVGQAFVYFRSLAGGLIPYAGPIGAEPIDPASEAAAGGCVGGTPTGAWVMHLRNGRNQLDLPLDLARPATGDPAGTGLDLDLCPATAKVISGNPPSKLSIAAVVLVLSDVDQPKTPGLYTWRALVAPGAADGTPVARSAYEVRALVPVPHILTLHGRYDAATRRAILTGALRLRGKPSAHAVVWLTRLDRKITPHGPVFRDRPAAAALTTRAGAYTMTVALPGTNGFVAATPLTTTRCRPPFAAPAGCKGESVAGTESTPITVSVP